MPLPEAAGAAGTPDPLPTLVRVKTRSTAVGTPVGDVRTKAPPPDQAKAETKPDALAEREIVLPVIERVAARPATVSVAEKVAETVQVAPGATVWAAQVLPVTVKSAAFGPAMEGARATPARVPVLRSVSGTVWVAGFEEGVVMERTSDPSIIQAGAKPVAVPERGWAAAPAERTPAAAPLSV